MCAAADSGATTANSMRTSQTAPRCKPFSKALLEKRDGCLVVKPVGDAPPDAVVVPVFPRKYAVWNATRDVLTHGGATRVQDASLATMSERGY